MTASQTIGIGVTPVVDIVADAIGTSEDTPVTFNALTNDSFEAANETVTALTQGASGTVSFLADGSITYTPDANFHGSDTFTYTVASSGVTESTTVTVNVGDVNDIPTTVGLADRSNLDNQTVSLDTSVFFADADNDPLSYTISGLPAGLTYNPSTGEISGTIDKSASIGGLLGDGVYAVVVTASDGFPGGTASATFTWSISNPPPTAVDDTSTTGEDQPVTIDVLGNDIDPDLDPLTVTNATAGHGTVTINPDGSIVYTPEADFNGTDTIVYEISDGNGGVSTAELSVIVTAVNDAPVATALTPISTVDSAPLTLDMAAAFTDVDADTLTFTAAGLPAGLSIDPDTGMITGTIDHEAPRAEPAGLHGRDHRRRRSWRHDDGRPHDHRHQSGPDRRRRCRLDQRGHVAHRLGCRQRQRSRRRHADLRECDRPGQRQCRGRSRRHLYLHAECRIPRHGRIHLHGLRR